MGSVLRVERGLTGSREFCHTLDMTPTTDIKLSRKAIIKIALQGIAYVALWTPTIIAASK